MKISHWIADLITGGALTAAHADILSMAETTSELLSDLAFTDAQARDATKRAHELQCDLNAATAALRTIASMPTPSANATVRRMAAVARDALK